MKYISPDFQSLEFLIIGGTGSAGKAITKLLCEKYNPKGIRIFSRDELKQKQMAKEFSKYSIPISYLIGDIRDLERLYFATYDADIVIHAAAMKHLDKCEYDPLEAKKTNIDGSVNVITACARNKVNKAILISTDKSVYPVNLYGATKMVAERIWINSNVYTPHGTKFSVCRYGNVTGSRGSVLEIFNQQKEKGELTITNKNMTRFWITLSEVSQFILNTIIQTKGSEIFIPKMLSYRIKDLAEIIGKDCSIKEIGTVDGEKLHEDLISIEESYHCEIKDDKYIINKYYYNAIPFTYASNYKLVLMNKERLELLLKEYLC